MRRLVCRVNSWVANMIPSAFCPAQANVFLLPLWPRPARRTDVHPLVLPAR